MAVSDVTAHFVGSCVASDDTWRYSVWVDGNGRVWAARQAAAGGTWESDVIDPALETVYLPPVTGHPTIGFGTGGGVHLFVNMNGGTGGTLKHFWHDPAIHLVGQWYPRLNPTDGVDHLPGLSTRSFYPMIWRVPSGRCRFWAAGGSGSGTYFGRANSLLFTESLSGGGLFGTGVWMHQGLEVANAKNPGTGDDDTSDTAFNWSPAPVRPAIQPTGVGTHYIEHWFWTWRQGQADGFSHEIPCYAQYRSESNTWHAIDNLPVTLPFDPVNQPVLFVSNQRGTAIGPGVEGWQAGGGMCLSMDNRPIVVISRDPWYRIEWTGYGWTQTVLGTTGGLTIGGVPVDGLLSIARIRGRYWYLGAGTVSGVTRPYAFTADEPDPDGSGRRWLPDPSDGVAIPLSNGLTGISGVWDVQPDLDALARGDGIVVLSGTETASYSQTHFGHPSGATV